MNSKSSINPGEKYSFYTLDTVQLDFFGDDQSSFRFSFFIHLTETQRVKLEFQILWDKTLSTETRTVPIIDSELNTGRMYFEVLHTLKPPGPTSLPSGDHKLLLLINGKKACLKSFAPQPTV
ncbi:MAG: hypothetical protein KC553_13865 [Nitrospina sp.]|nr:hypothetical protein [Nitrospina sp.]